jgi:hypothetical protein
VFGVGSNDDTPNFDDGNGTIFRHPEVIEIQGLCGDTNS